MIAHSEQILELTPTQEAMLIYSLYAPESTAYFEQVCFRYCGTLDVRAFAAAWQRVVERHEILRMSFVSEDGDRPRCILNSQVMMPVVHKDLRAVGPAEQRIQCDQFLRDDVERGFDLATAPLLRVAVLQTANDEFWIVVSNHHIILDGWSMSLLRQEVSEFYHDLVAGKNPKREEAPSFTSYLDWLARQDLTPSETFWRSQLSDFCVPNLLAVDSGANQGAQAAGSFGQDTLSLSEDITDAIRGFARKQHLTLSTLLQGAWSILLRRYSASDDVVFGITVSGRPYDLPGVESTVGLMINTLPVRARIDATRSISTLLKDLQRNVSASLEYEHCPLKLIKDWSGVPSQMPLFETLLVFENFAGSGSSLELGGVIEVSSAQLSRTNYPLTLVVNPASKLELQIVYHESRFTADVIRRMLLHLAEILKGIAAGAEQPVGKLSMLTAAESAQLLVEFNNTEKQFAETDSVVAMFERQAAATPSAVALIDSNRELTYGELNTKANVLAKLLRDAGVGRETLVGICVPRSLEMIAAILGTLKAGGAYVPLDPSYPQDRLAFMLEDSAARVVLTSTAVQNLSGFAEEVICVDNLEIESPSVDNIQPAAGASDAAYVIYTSGSTGKPKGTIIEHHSLSNFVQAAIESYGLTARDRVLQFASLSFDTSVEEIFPTLIAGATLVLRTDDMLSSADRFLQSCGDLGITVLDLPTAYWHELTDEIVTHQLAIPPQLRLIILGGEKAMRERVASWRANLGERIQLLNTYGPTEATIVTTMCDLTHETGSGEAPIGRPIANAVTYVLDSSLQPGPIGVPGELYIGGAGVARGYLNRPDLTEEKFIASPFGSERAPRLYRTGDLVRYRPDGNLEFLGRTDNQVKIRGFRVELEEIEQAIRAHAGISDVVVLATDEAGDHRLNAYMVVKSESQLTASDVRQFLIDRLPTYMVPARFAFVENIPVMPNGKTDRRALLSFDQPEPLDETFVAPQTPLQESIAEIWANVLRVNQPGIYDNFFELGGHSLMAAKLISNLRRQLNVELSLIDVFQAPTISKLATLIYERQTETAADDELAALLAEIETMSDEEAQQRLAKEINKGGLRAQALKLALITTGAIQLLSEAL
ncbi:MAG TPA: amino acid adenylation domain-containing protein [Pyrinomonadaceae bacterium]|nr:amino acid adenylation domain-containing protein [Pyrinomonadaceae bacterium]